MILQKINDNRFYVPNKDIYPPFKKGLYMEEYFLKYMIDNNIKYDKNGRLYIPALWTNFQIETWFNNVKSEMQISLNNYIENNECKNGYFVVVQYDDGPLLKLPSNTIIYGGCSGDIILPLIYEDTSNYLSNYATSYLKSYNTKKIFCSFIGSNTHKVRKLCYDYFLYDDTSLMCMNVSWSPIVNNDLQVSFINNTINSKFALAPRGYGRSSFRFFEILQLRTIPIYIWDDIEWLPYKEIIDYSKFCISINVSNLLNLKNILNSIDEEKYNNMKEEYEKVKNMFTLEYMCNYIINN